MLISDLYVCYSLCHTYHVEQEISCILQRIAYMNNVYVMKLHRWIYDKETICQV